MGRLQILIINSKSYSNPSTIKVGENKILGQIDPDFLGRRLQSNKKNKSFLLASPTNFFRRNNWKQQASLKDDEQ